MKTSLMNEPSPGTHDGPRPRARSNQRTWLEAYRAFLMSPRELITVKLLPLVAMGILPLSMADDLLLPVVGVMDDIPTALIVGFVIFRTWQRVRQYR